MAEKIVIHNASDSEGMRRAGRLTAEVLDAMADMVAPGVTTDEINAACHKMITGAGAVPAPLNYRGFPKSVCTSVNHVVCHGIPDGKKLKNGDIVNIDVTTIIDGWHGDASRMYFVGEPSVKAKKLSQAAYDGMMRGIEQVRPGATLGDIGAAVQRHVEGQGFSVVRDYCGHGIGKVFHAAPNILHYGKPGKGLVLQEGMFFTVEPMVNAGKPDTYLNPRDGWTVWSRDKSLSAQFEHTLAVTADGFEIFTLSPTGRHFPPYAA